MNLYEILGILFIHWFADFVLQTDKQAKGKSKNWSDLLAHTVTYSLVWWLIGLFHFKFELVMAFTATTFIFHTAQDYVTSRINSRLRVKGDVHNFFVSIGFDQWLHYAQLFITYQLLKQ